MINFTLPVFTHRKNSFKKYATVLALFLGLLISNLGFGQTDDFTDGNFTASPAWSGDTGSFAVITTSPLPNGAATTDGSYLASGTTNGNVTLSMASTEVNEWKFSLGTPTFSPASTNYFGVVLMSSVAVSGSIVATSWNGYYLKIGVNGTTDPIELWKKTGTGLGNKVGDFTSSPNYNSTALQDGLNIRVTRNSSGVFELFYSTGFTYASTPITSAGTLTDNTVTTSSFFGVFSVFANPGATRRVYIDNIVLGTPPAGITSATSGNWSSTSTWVGGVVPTSANNAIIANGHVVTMDTTTGGINTRNTGTTTTVNVGGTLATNVNYINNGTTTINGSFQLNSGGWVSDAGGTNALVYGAGATLIFNTAYTANNGNYWPSTSGPENVTVNTSSNLDLGLSRTVTGTFQTSSGITLTSSTLTLNGTARINTGGYFNQSPTYGSASTLVYNTGSAFGRGNEWTTATSGAGYPANVQISNPGTVTTLNMGTTSAQCSGNILIDASTVLNTTTAGLTVLGNVTTNGTIFLGGDVTTQGDWTVGAAATQTNNGKAVFFTKSSGNQIITKTGSGDVFFDYLVIDKAAGNVQLNSSTPTNVVINTATISAGILQLNNAGSLDLNGRNLTFNNDNGDIQVNGARNILSTNTGAKLIINGNKWIMGAGTLNIATNVTVELNKGLDFGSNKTTVNGILQINSGGYAANNAPIYASTSTLVYNGVTSYGVGFEWTGNATTAGQGTPQNVTLTTSSVNMPNSVRSLAGNLTIGTGSTLVLNGAFGADLNIGGNWSNSGTFTPSNAAVFFRGTVAQTISGSNDTTFDYLTINNSAGVVLSKNVINNLTLDLISGTLTLGTNNLTIGSSGTITNASATSYIKTNNTGQLKRTVGASNIAFPVGNSAYNPITFNNTGGTADVYGVGVYDGAITTGLNNTKTVSRRWATTEAVAGGSNLSVIAQYNTGEPNSGFAGATTPYIGFYNGTTWTQVGATLAGSNPFTATSTANSTPSDLTSQTPLKYFAIGKDNAFVSTATKFVITAISPTSPTAGSGFSVTVTSQDAYNSSSNVLANTSFTLTTNGNAGTIGGTVTGTILAGTNSIVVSGVTLSTAGTGATIIATQTSGDALSAGTSSPFNVLAAASQLVFVGVPATGTVGVNLTTFTVEARRPDNTVDNTFTGNITIAKASGSGTISGTLTQAAVAGVATFNNIQFNSDDTYTINNASGSLTPSTSGNIVISLVPVVLYYEDFGTSNAVVIPYTNGTNATGSSTLDSQLTTPVWNQNIGTGNFSGNPNGCISATTSATLTVTSVFNVDAGFLLNPTSLTFDYRATATGPQTLVISISGTGGSTTVNSFALNNSGNWVTTPRSFLSSTEYLSGQVTITYTFTGGTGGTIRLDNVNLFGNIKCVNPTAYTVTGGGAYCAGGSGIAVGLSNSQPGINYQLKIGGVDTGSPVAGTGSAITFGNQTAAGTYTVVASNTNSPCNITNVAMTGNAVITIDALPNGGSVTGGGNICYGSTSGLLTLVSYTGGTIARWESSVSPYSVWTPIANTTATYTSGPIYQTTQFRAIIQNGTCEVPSSPASVNFLTTTWTSASGGSWDFGPPSATTAAVIAYDYTSAGNINACTLTVNNNANVVIASGNDLILNGALTVTSGSLTLENTANLLQNTNVANSGNIIVKRNSSALKRLDYTLWCSPVTGSQTLVNFSPLTNSTRYYVYDTATSAYDNIASPSTTTFDLAKGYLIRMPNNWSTWAQVWNGQFTGEPNNGDKNFTLSTAGNGYNAVGNPYPSALDIDAFITANTSPIADNISGTLWFWRKTNNPTNATSYSTCTGSGCTLTNNAVYPDDSVISTGQGFIVKAKTNATTLSFTNAMRSGSNVNEFFKETQKNRYWIELFDQDNVSYGQNLIAYLPNATLGYDNGLDGLFIGDTKTTLLTQSDDKEVVIQARPEFNAQDVLPLQFKTDIAGTFSISLPKAEGVFKEGQKVYLRDSFTNTLHNLNEGAYTFTTEVGDFNNRFNLEYQELLSVNPNTFNENQVVIYKQKQEFVINSGTTIMKSVQVYDVRGRLLLDKNNINTSETKFTTGTTNQVLLVKIISENNEVVTKKVIQ